MNTFNEYIAEAGATTSEPLHWAVDSHVPNCILLKKGRKSILGIDFDGKNYTVMTDPKDKSSTGCQKSAFVDAFAMAQDLLKDKVADGVIPVCPSNIRRWLKHGSEKPQDDGIKESTSESSSKRSRKGGKRKKLSEASDEWEKATSSIPKDFMEWKKGAVEGEAILFRKRKHYIKIGKRLPDQNNSKFYKDWVKEKPYFVKWCAYDMDNERKHHLFWEYETFEEAYADAERHKKMDYSANALVFPPMPQEVKDWLELGRKNPNAEMVTEAGVHVFKWEVFKKNLNEISLILDGRYEVASIYRNRDKSADILPYALKIYSFNHACEFAGLEKSVADAVARIAKEIAHPIKLKGDPQMAGVEAKDIRIPPVPTKARLWLDQNFSEAVLTEKK